MIKPEEKERVDQLLASDKNVNITVDENSNIMAEIDRKLASLMSKTDRDRASQEAKMDKMAARNLPNTSKTEEDRFTETEYQPYPTLKEDILSEIKEKLDTLKGGEMVATDVEIYKLLLQYERQIEMEEEMSSVPEVGTKVLFPPVRVPHPHSAGSHHSPSHHHHHDSPLSIDPTLRQSLSELGQPPQPKCLSEREKKPRSTTPTLPQINKRPSSSPGT
ncbi:leucyl aminopeptidase [Planoprotostelium fungivorum]|uniref:Leucyl aminopeptidase n=1 Tax=Planoprotostelium fungivorum TaxID=1890364 RepID=A0A2P6MPC1_9EUKA|nr:leucyl aminopeptidase [Planoprotostelium fungivorum]